MIEVLRAAKYAVAMHGDQKRKYTGEPYVAHCFDVAHIVALSGGDEEMVIAAILHDVVEDTPATVADVEREFGMVVATYVEWLTDVSKSSDGNRETRKRLDREHIARAPAEVQTIKVADLISNTSTIVQHDPDFAKVYLAEKRLLLDVLTQADRALILAARSQVAA